jgi:uncharacterized protein (TIGR03083 family)
MEYEAHVSAVERETADIVTALRAGSLDVSVPTCPEWTLDDLANHLIGFTEFWIHSLQGRGSPRHLRGDASLEEFGRAAAGEPTDDRLIGRYEALAEEMLGLLRSLDPRAEVWTWMPDDQSAGFVGRRAAHELAVHRFDAQSARGTPLPIDAALAADGIEEIFVMSANFGRATEGANETLHLHGAEGYEWMITIGPERLSVTREHAKGDLALRGAVSDLELVLYDRPPIGEIEQFGDPGVLDVWHRAFRFG